MNNTPLVSIVMGSDSDLDIMNEAAKALADFGIPYEIDITSAHRSPARTSEYSRGLKARGVKVVIAGAGGAAHLAGVIAAETTVGGHWRVPASEVERLKRDGLPPRSGLAQLVRTGSSRT